MKTIKIFQIPGTEEWRREARIALHNNLHPNDILWLVEDSTQSDLFDTLSINKQEHSQNQSCNHRQEKRSHASIAIPKSAIELFNMALCHKDPQRFSLCYRVLWRIVFEDRYLLQRKTDNDIITLTALVKAVRRDAYKMSAYLRFRKIDSPDNETERFVAWYEPEHYSLELKLDFFKTRFKNMQWSILTPYRAAHWDMTSMVLQDTPSRAQYPKEDEVEKYWLTYYANIFNPARPKKKAMLSSMPKKYWKNMPETVLIEDLIRTAESKSRKMIDNAASD